MGYFLRPGVVLSAWPFRTFPRGIPIGAPPILSASQDIVSPRPTEVTVARRSSLSQGQGLAELGEFCSVTRPQDAPCSEFCGWFWENIEGRRCRNTYSMSSRKGDGFCPQGSATKCHPPVVDRITSPECPCPNPRVVDNMMSLNPLLVPSSRDSDVPILPPTTCEWQKGLCRCDSIRDLEVGTRAWIMQVGPTSSQGSLQGKAGGSESEKHMWS